MNKKIQQLIRQSNGFWEHGDYGFSSTVCFSEENIVKFVENIVKECLRNMENDDGDLDFAIWKTKQDFGIE